jgi:hypothetical protein
MMPACLKSCNLQSCPAQGCEPVGCRRLKGKLFNRYVIVYDCGRDLRDHVIIQHMIVQDRSAPRSQRRAGQVQEKIVQIPRKK